MDIIAGEQFGRLCSLRASASAEIKSQTLFWLRNSVDAGTYKIFTDNIGRPVGYIAWANINRETATRLIMSEQLPKYPYEWREGFITLILDVAFTDKRSMKIKKMLADFLTARRAITFVRRNRVRLFIKKKGDFQIVKINYPAPTQTASAMTEKPDSEIVDNA